MFHWAKGPGIRWPHNCRVWVFRYPQILSHLVSHGPGDERDLSDPLNSTSGLLQGGGQLPLDSCPVQRVLVLRDLGELLIRGVHDVLLPLPALR